MPLCHHPGISHAPILPSKLLKNHLQRHAGNFLSTSSSIFILGTSHCHHPGHITLSSPCACHLVMTLGTSCCHHPGQLPPCFHPGMYTVSDVTQFWGWSLSISVILTARWNLSPLLVQLAFWDGQSVEA